MLGLPRGEEQTGYAAWIAIICRHRRGPAGPGAGGVKYSVAKRAQQFTAITAHATAVCLFVVRTVTVTTARMYIWHFGTLLVL